MSKNKSRSFSIYLLKQGYDANNALEADHGLGAPETGRNLPVGATLYVMDNVPTEPWWRSYFGIDKNLKQVSKGAIVFLPVKKPMLRGLFRKRLS